MGRGAVLGKPHARLSAVQRGCMMLLYAAGSGLGRVVEFLNTISCLPRHHKLQLPLLLEMVQNQPHNQVSKHMFNLLLG